MLSCKTCGKAVTAAFGSGGIAAADIRTRVLKARK
jgi:hypothetical protein